MATSARTRGTVAGHAGPVDRERIVLASGLLGVGHVMTSAGSAANAASMAVASESARPVLVIL